MRLNNTTATHSQSRFIIIAFMCLLILSGIHCGVNKDHTRPLTSTVTVAHPGLDGRGLSPAVTDEDRYLVFLPLLTINEKGELVGWLARSWEYSPDYREVTYHLRTDIRWHDGVPVTAHDIKFSMELMTRPDVLEEGLGYFGSITVLNDSTLRIRDGNAEVDEVYWPKHLLEHLDPKKFYDWEFWKHPVGNGPYRFVRYVPQTMMEFEANPDYFRGKPRIERVILKFSGKAGLTELLSGNVDVVLNANPLDILKLDGDPRFRIYHHNDGWWLQQVIYWQHKHSLFREASIRQALTLAIDRRGLLRVIAFPENTPLVDGPYSLRQFRLGQFPEPLPYDIERARALLVAAGWHDRDGDGTREREGQAFRFTVLVSSYPAYNEEMAVYIQDKLRRIGVKMDIQIMETTVVLSRVIAGDFEAALTTFFLSGPIASSHSSLGYKKPKLDSLLSLLPDNPNPDTEDRLYREIMEIFQREIPVTFLVPRMQATFVHRRVQGLSTPWRANPLWFMEHLWLEDEES